jgi:hypothetical protein
LTGSLVSLALLGAVPVEAGTASTAAKARAPGTGAPLLFPAGVGSSIRLPAGLYPAKPPAPGKGVPLRVRAGVGNRAKHRSRALRGLDCEPVGGFKSEANDRYIVAQLDYGVAYPRHNLYGMLRAHATHVGPWEKFQFCRDKATNLWSIFSNANDRWVVTQLDYPSRDKYMLRANATSIGPWEQYYVACVVGGNGKFVIYSFASKRYVTAQLDYTGKDYGMLRAQADTGGPWEIFTPGPFCPS